MRKGTQLREAEMGMDAMRIKIYGLIDISLYLQDSKVLFFLGTGNGIHFLLPKKDKFNEAYWWPFWEVIQNDSCGESKKLIGSYMFLPCTHPFTAVRLVIDPSF